MFNFSINLQDETKNKLMLFSGLIVLSLMMSVLANAGTDTTFDAWTDTMVGWMEGSLGKGIAIAAIIIGAISGAARGSLMAFAIGVGFALGMFYTPDVIDSMFTAVL